MSRILPDYDDTEIRRASGRAPVDRAGSGRGRMEFRILGPLEVRSERGVLALGGVKPRAVLAVLLLHANEPVSADRLALALWGEEASAGAVKTVQVHMSRLRKALGDGDIVTTTAAGYRLRVRPGELDAERFERLAEEGRRALAAGQAEQSATILREALSLWRGPPLAELSFEPFAQTEIARLEEQRLAALEARVDAELAAGWHMPLISELQQLVAENPTRERLAGQLMLALYRSGRQADALSIYSKTRKALVTEIGMEPGPELRDLQEAILRHDEALLHSAAAGEAQSPARELPRQLDTANSDLLVSRTTELAWLREHWDHAQRGAGAVVAILGPAGSGKTRVAAALAEEVHRQRCTVGYVSGSDPPAIGRAALIGARGATQPTLVVLDDADRADSTVLAELHDLRQVVRSASLLVVVTARDGEAFSDLAGSAVLALTPLDGNAVREIARGYAPGYPADAIPADWLLEASGGIPRRIHELASQWAQREAARKVGVTANRAAERRAALWALQEELAGELVDLQAAQRAAIPMVTDQATVVCPFKGLAPFESCDAEYFCGRERLVAELVAHLVGASLLGVAGPSGTGKSSAVRAGLLPALAAGALPGSDAWRPVVMRPGAHPMRELTAAALTGVPDDRSMLLAVDQFEETFTACRDESEREAFVSELLRVADDRGRKGIVVIVIRADHYGRCAAYPALGSRLGANHVLVGPMRPDELKSAIEIPAVRAGLRVEPALLDALVTDVKDQPGALPLLSTTLLELWQRRDGRHLRQAAYERSGGVSGAVARLAEDVFGQLDQSQQAIARSMFLRLLDDVATNGPERRRVPLPELEPERDDAVAGVLALLIERRLLIADAGTVEIAHDAVLSEWPRLRSWYEEDAEGHRLHRHLIEAAREWDRGGRDPDELYVGARLASAREWRATHPEQLNRVEREFVTASEARENSERASRRRRIQLAFLGLVTALVAISIVAVVAVRNGMNANRQRDIAVSGELTAQATAALLADDPERSVGKARQAVAAMATPQAGSALRQALLAFHGRAVLHSPGGPVYGADMSADGRWAVGGSGDGKLRVWNLRTGRITMTIPVHQNAALMPRFGPAARWIVSGGVDGSVVVTEPSSGHNRTVMRDPTTAVSSLAVDRYDARVAAGYRDGTIRIAALEGPSHIHVLRGGRRKVLNLAFNPDDTRLASVGDDGTIRIWDLTGARPPLVIHGGRDGVGAVSFDSSGRELVTGDAHGVVQFWHADTGAREKRIEVGDRLVRSLSFSPDGRRIAVASGDGTIPVVDVLSGRVTAVLRRHDGTVWDARFGYGNTVISSGDDATVRLWDAGTDQVISGPVALAEFSPDGRFIVAGGLDRHGIVRLWKVADGSLQAQLRGHRREALTARFSTDGRKIVSSSLDGTVRVWGAPHWAAEHVFLDAGAEVYAADFDPGARRIVMGDSKGRVIIRSLSGSPPVVLTGHRGLVTDVSFSPDGHRVVSAGDDGTVRIWDPARFHRPVMVLLGHRGPVESAVFSHDGRYVVSAGDDGTIHVWNLSDRHAVVLHGHKGRVYGAAFDPAGDRLVSAGADDGTVRIWDPRGGDPLVTLQQHNGLASNATFSPDGSQVLSTGDDGIIWVSSCRVCGSLADVVALAQRVPTGR